MMRFSLLCILFLLLIGCKKSEDRTCIKSTGDETVVTIDAPQGLDSLYLFDDIFYELIEDEHSRIEIHAGENLQNHIDFALENGKITLNNHNRCDWVRGFDSEINVKIYAPEFRYIHYEGYNKVISSSTLTSQNLFVYMHWNAGEINMDVDVGYLEVIAMSGWGNFNLSGNTGVSFLVCKENSFCDATDLNTKASLKIVSESSANMRVNADHVSKLEAETKARGNIYYTGQPEEVVFLQSGEGEIIHND